MDAFLISFGIIFIAELGDKSQLMAMTFATRYRATTILAAITVATAVVHLFSVAVGAVVGAALPTDAISIAAGLAFLAFAVWTVRGDELSDDDEARAARAGQSVFVTVAVAFFLAELGDKTMLATVTLATDNGVLGTWIGSTLGMVAADGLAINRRPATRRTASRTNGEDRCSRHVRRVRCLSHHRRSGLNDRSRGPRCCRHDGRDTERAESGRGDYVDDMHINDPR